MRGLQRGFAAQAADLALDHVLRGTEPGQETGDRFGVLVTVAFLVNPFSHPPDVVEAFLWAHTAVGGVGHPAHEIQHELVGSLDHSVIVPQRGTPCMLLRWKG